MTHPPPESRLQRVTLKALYFLLRLYLLPLKRLLYMKTAPGSLCDKLRHNLKIRLAGNANLLMQVLDPDMPELHSALNDNRTKVLYRLLSAQESALLNIYLNDPGRPARQALKAYFSPGSTEVKELMLADNAVRLDVLLPPDSDSLYQIMLRDDAARLKAVLAQKDFALTKKVFSVRAPITDAAFAHGKYKALRQFLFENDYKTLVEVLEYDAKGVYPRLLLRGDAPIFQALTSETGAKLLRDLLFQKGLMHTISQEHNAKVWCDFEKEWDTLKGWFPQNSPKLESRLAVNRALLSEHKSMSDCLLDAVYDDEEVVFRNGILRFTERHALLTLLKEILVNEDYYAAIENPAPYIIDCGAHQGLSLYYFKTIYPNARITAFEPDAANRFIAEENMRRNNFSDVEILPYAVAAKEGVQRFYRYRGQSMASSLVNRQEQIADTPDNVETIDVACVRLSDYLQEDIDYLKLDIEGAEDTVLFECEAHLHRVHYLFCEYHHLPGLPRDRLTRIMALLDRTGFNFHITKAYNFGRRSQFRPMNHIDEYYSAIVFAKNRGLNRQANDG